MYPNFILIGIDTLRADHLGCYGYVRNTSPNIDRIAGEGILFKNAFANGIPTHPAWTTILTGAHPLRHKIVTHMGEVQLSKSIPMVQEVLRKNGYATVAVDNMFLKYGSFYKWFTRGFNIYSHPGGIPAPEAGLKVQAENVTEISLKILQKLLEEKKPFFLFLHYWDPHAPYKPPSPFNRLFWKKDFPGNESLLDFMISQYDGEIAYCDSEVGRLLEFLSDNGLFDKTIIIVTADHGENLMEHGNYMGHRGLYDCITRIPLIIRFPNKEYKGVIDSFAQHIDITPTILTMIDAKIPSTVDGISLINVIENKKKVKEVLMVENTLEKAMALRTMKWKLIIHLGKTPEEIPSGYVRLYNILKDRMERINLASHELKVVKNLKKRLDETVEKILAGGENPLLIQSTRTKKIKAYSEAKSLIELYGLLMQEKEDKTN